MMTDQATLSPGSVGSFSITDDYGDLSEAQRLIVVDDFGIQVTDNPIWAEQRLDPHRVDDCA